MPIRGYASLTSVLPGEGLGFHLASDPPGRHRLRILRTGTSSPSVETRELELRNLGVPRSEPWARGFYWPRAMTLDVPHDWPTGFYEVRDDTDVVLTFVVRSPAPGLTSRVLLQICVNTPQAYNGAGGRSLYETDVHARDTRALKVSFNRPEKVGRPERGLVNWLERERIDVDYCTSIDLHDGAAMLDRYDLLISAGHDEYWSRKMRDRVESFVRNGGNVAFFTGNTCMRQVRFEDRNRTMVCVKAPGADRVTNDDVVTVDFAQPPVNRPQNELLGVGFDHGGWTGGSGNRAYAVRFPDHWVFDGLPRPIRLPDNLVGYECDAADYVDDEGYPRVTGADGSPLTFTILATSDARDWVGKPGRATMGLYTRNGTVFNAAVVAWARLLSRSGALQRITRNVIERLGQRRDWDRWELIGHANHVRAMTALDGRLFCATSDDRLWRRFPVGADVSWREIGHANRVTSMAASGNRLFCLTSDGVLWHRTTIETDVDWTRCGRAPDGGARAFAAAGGMLYCVDRVGRLLARPATLTFEAWRTVSSMERANNARIQSMTSYSDILFATTSDNRLLRTDWDFVWGSALWIDVLHANHVTGLACLDGMLFAATEDDGLWWLDIRGLRKP